jgi:hypothetical protein
MELRPAAHLCAFAGYTDENGSYIRIQIRNFGRRQVTGYAAKQWDGLGLTAGDLTIRSADTTTRYERRPLSEGFLAGKDTEESIRINTEDFYCQP